MKCPREGCPGNTSVVDSREVLRGAAVRRRRACPACLGRFTTYERRTVRVPRPPAPDPREVLYLRAAIAALKLRNLEPCTQMAANDLADAAIAGDWSACERLNVSVLVLLNLSAKTKGDRQ